MRTAMLAVFVLASHTPAITNVYDGFRPPVRIGVERGIQQRTARPVPFPGEGQKWVRLRTAHFDLISSADVKQTEAIARDFETLAAALSRVSPRFQVAATPTTVFVMGRRRDSQPYFDLLLDRQSSPATGVYVRYESGGAMFIDANKRIARTAVHELTHGLLRESERVLPLWLEEGLAEVIGNATIREGALEAGEVVREHASLLKSKKPQPIEEMFALESSSIAVSSPQFYAQSWAAVQWLMQAGPLETFFAFAHDLESRMPVEDALQKHYAKSVRDLERGSRTVGARRIRIEVPADFAFTAPQPVELDRPTLLFELGQFLSFVSTAQKEPERHYREAIRLNPRHAPALAAVGEFDAAIAASPEDPAVRLTYAESLLTNAIGAFAVAFDPKPEDPARFRKARELLANVDTPLAHGLKGTSYLLEDDVRPGIVHLEQAPHRDDFLLNLYTMYLRVGDRVKADALFARSLENARSEQTRFGARNLLLIAETNRANDLSRRGELQAAAQVVRELAAMTPDPKSRRELELDAAKLEATALVNQHIRRYNEAIGLSNTGKKREALRVLEELIAVATDPVVLRDARKLAGDLRK